MSGLSNEPNPSADPVLDKKRKACKRKGKKGKNKACDGPADSSSDESSVAPASHLTDSEGRTRGAKALLGATSTSSPLSATVPGGVIPSQGVSPLEANSSVPFDAAEWIGVGKLYKEVPIEVSDACCNGCKIPADLQATFPSRAIPASWTAIKKSPPRRITGSVSSRQTATQSLPSGQTPSPRLPFLCELENDYPQKWMNGAISVLDPLQKSIHLPLFAVAFYCEIHRLREAQDKWHTSVQWAQNKFTGRDLEIFARVSWNTVHPDAPDGQLDWTRLVDDEWVSDGIIDTMMADIQSRATRIRALASVTVAPLSLQRAIISISTEACPSKYTLCLLTEYKSSVVAGKSLLYFPLHVNGNHWIMFHIDFIRNVFGYGDSFGKKSAGSQFTPHLVKWLKSSFHGTFMNLGDMLPHPQQGDFVHCGIYAAHTLEHALFQTPLISYADCGTVRMAWFRIFASKGLSRTHITPLLANHNFPDLGPVNFFGEEISSPAVTAPPTLSSVPNAAKNASRPPKSANPPLIKLAHHVDLPPRNSVAPSKMTVTHKRRVADHSSSDKSDSYRGRAAKKRTKETQPRKRKTTSAERKTYLLQDLCTVKLSPDELKGSPSEVYCLCSPGRACKLDQAKKYNLKNWELHKKTCELVTGVKAGARTTFAPFPTTTRSSGIASFFSSTHKSNSSLKQAAQPVPIKKVIVADKRIGSFFFVSAQLWTRRIPPPIIIPEETECLGLHGEGYEEYAWQKGTSYLGGLSVRDWTRISRHIFPYKNWDGVSDSETDTNSDTSDAEAMPEKAVRAAGAMTEATHTAMKGIRVKTNTVVARRYWTDYEKKPKYRISVRQGLPGGNRQCVGDVRLMYSSRQSSSTATSDFAAKWQKKVKHTPLILRDSAAIDVKASLANPAVMKILSSKALHGPGGAFLALYQQAQTGDLEDKESFLAICDQFTDRVRRGKDPTGRAMKGIWYSPELGQLAALMRSHGPRSGVQYDLFKGMFGGISQRQLRRLVAKSAMKMVSSELCAGNLEAAVEFGKLMKWEGPWICAGDGTKLRPLLSMSTEYSEGKSAHVVGSTQPLSDTGGKL
ncbi:hypothetical protein K438DRAFT_2146173 [Mycena galopus ATCC 62051]|nr:hypothetical protein K438DRAFT_2146173 [Mycena galopus ATCC 62051]